MEATIFEGVQEVWVKPASDFAGAWVTYFVNGRPSRRIECRDGKYQGTFTAFHANGAKSYVQHKDGIS